MPHHICRLTADFPWHTYRHCRPTADELAAVPHHFVAALDLDRQYSAAQYEADVMALLPRLWEQNPVQVMCGGSMMYIDAVVRGIDELPTISPEVRAGVMRLYEEHGLDAVRAELRRLDPVGATRVDPANPRRNIHALEICIEAGVPASTLLTGEAKERPFDIEMYHLPMERAELFDRINRRVDAMVRAGLVEEARSVYHLRHLNSLNTVGYKELFAAFDGTMPLPVAIERIKKNTRVYAKKQLTWLRRYPTLSDVRLLYDKINDNRQRESIRNTSLRLVAIFTSRRLVFLHTKRLQYMQYLLC